MARASIAFFGHGSFWASEMICGTLINGRVCSAVKTPAPSLEPDPDSKVHGANMGPIWGRQDPGGPHIGPMSLAIWGATLSAIGTSGSDGGSLHLAPQNIG